MSAVRMDGKALSAKVRGSILAETEALKKQGVDEVAQLLWQWCHPQGGAAVDAQAAHPAEGELLGESLFQGLGMFLAAPVKQHGHGPAGEPEAHNDDDARNEQRGDGVRHMQNAPEGAVRRKVFAGLHAKQADEHDSGGPDVRGEMQGVGFHPVEGRMAAQEVEIGADQGIGSGSDHKRYARHGSSS